MASSSTQKFDTLLSTTKYPSSRRTPSFSSSSSSSSSSATLSPSLGSSHFQDDSPLSPAAPVRFSGVPFSWESLPGIPKKLQNHKKNESIKLLPLPPPATPPTSRKKILGSLLSRKKTSIATAAAAAAESFRKDPFFTELVECSKDDDNDDDDSKLWRAAGLGAKVTRSISDRFGFINLCCKRSCSVSESIVYLPTANYGLIHRPSR
ncbi:Protease-associated RING/U-box zinc finger family protein [Hibiscus syriacus]|uniref:Protease-associated RING/U-box zinc finger family protein n=1 Tax=Hibiscus syriacus TaxID=106335 RepID=A0A6A2Y1U9_HIBSY|nr:uncharacterized protein LOC120164453 [Hibiscus syriacus]KAE8677360.1 Protease-associated RING/U-box zinc finger family protein [Hibiscus syriacus]